MKIGKKGILQINSSLLLCGYFKDKSERLNMFEKDTLNTGMSWSDFATGSAKLATVVALQLGVAGVAHAAPPVVGASVPGVPAGIYLQPSDSSMGIKQAVAANPSGTCGAGYVFSGGSCVLIPVPAAYPTCSYGMVYSGNACVHIAGFTPPAISCASGQVLSGGVCVALPPPAPPSCPSGTVLSGGSCVALSGGGGGGGGGYTPPPPTCPSYQGMVYWGPYPQPQQCSAYVSVGSNVAGGIGTVNNTNPEKSGYITFQCQSVGYYTPIQELCQ